MRIHARGWLASLGTAALALALVGPASAANSKDSNETAWLGVSTQELTPELQEGLDYAGPGVIINRVVTGSPAARAGVRKGDVLVRLNSRQVASPDELVRMVRAGSAGDVVSLTIVRDGERRSLRATLGTRSDDEAAPAPTWRRTGRTPQAPEAPEAPEPPEAPEFDAPAPGPPDANFDFEGPEIEVPEGGFNMFRAGRGRLGIRIESLNEQLGEYFGVPQGQGVLIVEVLNDTPAERAGLKAGDIITRVGNDEVSDSDDLIQALSNEEDRVTLTVIRKGVRRTVAAQLEQQRSPRVLRLRRGDGLFRWNDRNFTRGFDRMGRVNISGKSDAEVRKELRELQDELRELKKEMEELKSE